jgi:hypothetical protein
MEPLPDFTQEALRVADLAKNRGIVLRVMGACAVRIHCPKYGYLSDKLGRQLTDLDFMSYDKYMPKMERFFEEIGYQPRRAFSLHWGHEAYKRQFFDDPKNKRHVDVFFDELEMSHTISFKRRLELDYPTITLADLMLEKMQIVKINEKDIKDAIVLLREHNVGQVDEETVNSKYIADLLSNDWGFYYTVTGNLDKVKRLLREYDALSEDDIRHDANEIDKLLRIIEEAPKSVGWKMRAKIGTRKKWYTEVGEAALPGTSDGE